MAFTLDTPTTAQARQIAAIWAAGWHEAHGDIVPAELRALRTPQSFHDRSLNNLTLTRVARDGAEVLGFCMVKDDEIYQMYVAPQARGAGVAAALMQDGETRMREAGHHRAWLACAIGNTRAARFYEKSGWSHAGRQVVDLETREGAFPLEIWRFEKPLGTGAAPLVPGA